MMGRTLEGGTNVELQHQVPKESHLMGSVYQDECMSAYVEWVETRLERWKEESGFWGGGCINSGNKKLLSCTAEVQFQIPQWGYGPSRNPPLQQTAWQAVNSERRWTFFIKA